MNQEKTDLFEVVVIGAGIVGSATAYYLAKEFGNKTLLLEQFDFLHRRGSSHGESRIIRRTYPEEHYTFLMNDAYAFWAAAEKEYGSKVHTNTGGIDISNPDAPMFQSLLSSAKKFNVPFEILSPEQTSLKFPTIKVPEGQVVLYSPDGGVLNATKSVSMFQTLAMINGCQLKDNSPVQRIEELKTKDGSNGYIIVQVSPSQIYLTKKVVVTAGPWTKKFFKANQNLDLPLRPKLTTTSYWKVDDPKAYSSDRFPIFISYSNPMVYGNPAREYPNMIKCASAAHAGIDCDPDERHFGPLLKSIQDEVSSFLQNVFTGVEPEPTIIESCMYTDSPDYGFIIDKIPNSENIFIGCGFSGHGFKLGPVVGKMLTNLVVKGQGLYPNLEHHFKLNRFD